ncbi:MAG TPA: hypothetical protein VFO76_09385 [Candidatus Kapabacteria bacterium]|nr:hypothetical protein [Candidatus Kapabacteria bacterium]
MKFLVIISLALLLASCDPLVEGSISVRNATRDTVKVVFNGRHTHYPRRPDSLLCYPDSTNQLFHYGRIGHVNYVHLSDELDSITASNNRTGHRYNIPIADSLWRKSITEKGWGGGIVDYLYELK